MITLAQNSNIRRIDELGRIVIPKDIRKKLHIKSSETLEIYVVDEEIHIKKYSPLPDIEEYVKNLFDICSRVTGNEYIFTSREIILAATDESLKGKSLNEELKEIVLNCIEKKNEDIHFLLDDITIMGKANIIPVIVDADRTGLLIEYNKSHELKDLNTIKIFAKLIEKQLNNY